MSAFCSAGCQYLSSGFRAHSLAETVNFGSLALLRLKSHLHKDTPPLLPYLKISKIIISEKLFKSSIFGPFRGLRAAEGHCPYDER